MITNNFHLLGGVASDPNAVHLIQPNDLSVKNSGSKGYIPVGGQRELGAFYGHTIGVELQGGMAKFEKPRCSFCSLEVRNVRAKKFLSCSMRNVRNISLLKSSWVKIFAQCRGCLGECERNLRATFMPIFISRGESPDDIEDIKNFISEVLSGLADSKLAKETFEQSYGMLIGAGAMALFGILNSALDEVKRSSSRANGEELVAR